MRPREAPPLATWALRHLIAGNPNEALDGDLLEVLRTGRSNGWYWRLVLAAAHRRLKSLMVPQSKARQPR